ncbi:MAG TPA: nitroreductase [Gemmataceae bacterium]|nr:nitroreductase [Gemmataceae bacterium]
MNVHEAIYSRRSVRDYTDQPVLKATVEELIHAAIQAPSAINQQPWTFAVIQDKSLLRSFSDRAKDLMAKTMHLEFLALELREMLSDRAFNIFYNAGTLIVVFAKPVGAHPDWDCCLASQNLMLAAHDMGLATCPIGFAWSLFESNDVKEELGIPAEYRPILPIIVGYPKQPPPPVSRKEPEIHCWK